MTKAELLAVAEELGIDVTGITKTADLKKLIDEYTAEHDIKVENEVIIEETPEPKAETKPEPKGESRVETATLPELTYAQMKNMSHQLIREYNKKRNNLK